MMNTRNQPAATLLHGFLGRCSSQTVSQHAAGRQPSLWLARPSDVLLLHFIGISYCLAVLFVLGLVVLAMRGATDHKDPIRLSHVS
jgi:hypothetical protein